MSIRKLLAELKQQGIVVQVNNEQLTIKSTVSPISPDAIRKLKQHKQTLIGYLKQLEMAPMTIHKISDAVKSHGVGISIQQLSLWPLYQMGQAAHYNIPVCYALPVEVNTERLCQALIQVYQQHDALHSIFVDNGEQVLLRPRIDTNWQAQVELISPDSLETTVIKAYQQEQARQFDLVNDTLFVARLL
ncbi:condensation domain-containing protein, partial [Shewanella denitrificans]